MRSVSLRLSRAAARRVSASKAHRRGRWRRLCGQIDLIGNRWDAADHPPRHPRRVTANGDRYGPVHDLQIALEGPAASKLGELARAQWRCATGEHVRGRPAVTATAWPPAAPVDFSAVPVGITRTDRWCIKGPVHEIENLTRDALMTARRCIYIEAQYLTSQAVSEALATRLRDPDGPEIVIILCAALRGYLERLVMATNRDRLIRRLKGMDRYDRLRTYYVVAADGRHEAVLKMHAKLMIVDDRLLRLGSSNLNNRSMGVDLECDVAVEADDEDSRQRILTIRDRLLASHLKTSPDKIAAAVRAEGSLIRAIERLDTGGRLHRFPAEAQAGSIEPMFGTALLDPVRPLTPRHFLRRWLSPGGRPARA